MSRQETWREIMDGKKAVINRLRDQRNEYKRQRDALLDALENLLAWDETDLSLPGRKAKDVVAALAAVDSATGRNHYADEIERYANATGGEK